MGETPPGAEMRRRVEAYDWATTPLGPRDGWPTGLATRCSTSRYGCRTPPTSTRFCRRTADALSGTPDVAWAQVRLGGADGADGADVFAAIGPAVLDAAGRPVPAAQARRGLVGAAYVAPLLEPGAEVADAVLICRCSDVLELDA